MYDNGRNGEKRFAIVDNGWAAVEADDGGKRWFQAGIATLALKGFHQGALFSADIGSCTTVYDHVQAVATAEDILADVARGVGFCNSTLKLSSGKGEFATY